MTERRIGRHTIRFEPPWCVFLVARGDIGPEDITGIAEFIKEHGRDAAFLMALNDMRELGEISAATRKETSRVLAGLPFRALAYVGGFRQRLIVKMATVAIQLLSPSFRGVKIGLFDTQAEARDWLAERAQELAAAGEGSREKP